MKYRLEDIRKTYDILAGFFKEREIEKFGILSNLMGSDDAARAFDFINSADDLLNYLEEQETWEQEAEALKRIKENEKSFNKVREEVFDDLLNAQNRESKDEREVLTSGDLYNYMEYLEEQGCIEIDDDREEWEK